MRKNYLLTILAALFCINASAQSYQKVAGKAKIPTENIQKSVLLSSAQSLTDFSDGFESYTNFSLEFAPWTVVDVDGSETWGIEGIEFENQYSPMGFMIFNPSSTTPPMTTTTIQPHSGSKFAASFAAQTPPNNDWLISPPLVAGSGTSVSFWVKSYTAQYGLERYKVGVSTTDASPESFTIISGSNYLTAPADIWEQKTFDLNAYNGQTIYVGIQCVSNDAFIFMVDDFSFTTTTSQTNSLTGLVTDAFDGSPIEGALVSIAGLTATTDENGNYTISNIPAGTLNADFNSNVTQGEAPLGVNFFDLSTEGSHTVSCSKEGYITYVNNQVVIEPGQTLNLNISLSQTLMEGSMRFVLNWGAEPTDLDSHLNTPAIEGQAYHIFYSSQGSATSAPYAALDHDVTSGYGPETMTIYQMFNGTYQYYIHNYSESPAITISQAVLQIYNQNGLIQTLQVPTSGTGLYWYVCDINGANGQITIKNTIQANAPGTFKETYPEKENNHGLLNSKNITSWLWNFGDGTTSTLQNPSHTYNTAGTYNVSLTVNGASGSDTETKNGYITVTGGTVGNSTLTGQVTNATNGNPVAGALVSIAGLSAITDNNGNYTINNVPAGVLVANFAASQTSGAAPLTVNFADQSTENSSTVTCSAADFITYSNNQVVIPAGGSLTLNISLSPILAAGNMRFVLNWGASPSDLDSHLNTPEIEGQAHHIFYNNEGNATSAPYALLDYDITTGYGPETMTIYQMFNGTYQYYIHNYSETPDITTSQAVVQIYNQAGLLHTLQIPTSGTGLYWYVCDVNGATGQITLRNVIQATAPGSFRDKLPVKQITTLVNNERNIISWSWDFGDGSTSNIQNPSHTFNANGNYTISLTVNNGSTQSTETKVAYIQVGPQGIGENNLSQQIKLYPVPAAGHMQVESPVKIDLLRITDLSGLEVFKTEVNEYNCKLDVSNLRSGIYFILIDTESGRAVQKFTVN
ncbi:MAG: carboxypeptidase regulatory-like domain-containing protein [Lentimicrobiaceae bacterium]|nr:carboxypeptidase regulatory-like domain-containing protein [Lentimicrobiaceae bacterium]MCO5264906.1 PKD domain-containing protein [Lentimicrobium sp.]